MTDLGVAPEVEQLRDIVGSFSRDRLASAAEEAESTGSIPAPIMRSLNELGILSPLGPGAEQEFDPVALVVVAEELGAGDPGIAYETIIGAHAALAVGQLGTAAQLDVILGQTTSELPSLGSLWCYEGFGRGPDEYRITIVCEDDNLTLDGHKIAVVRPGTADFAVVIGRASDRTVAVLLDREQLVQCSVVRDDRDSGKLGLKAAHTGDVRLSNVKVSAGSILAGSDELAVSRLVASARLCTASVAVGAGMAALSYAAEYATTRTAFGQPISSYQGVSFPLAEADMALRGARAAILDLAFRLDIVADDLSLARQTGQVVAAATQAALLATATGINTLGGHGYLTDYPVERWYRAAGTLAAIDNDPLLFG
jgi:acyl-CoA dehydrogenase